MKRTGTTRLPPILPVILAGGRGARLAPYSTDDCPKPFLPLPMGGSLLSHTVARAQAAAMLPPILVGQASHRFALLNHARDAGVTPQAVLLEPAPRNTALAIATAVHHALAQHGPDICLAILPADHWIVPTPVWAETLQRLAMEAIAREAIGLLGVRPTRIEPGFGHFRCEEGTVSAFVEKPADPAALPGEWWWNAGQFVASAGLLAARFETLAPALWQAACEALAHATADWEFTLLAPAPYLATPETSFDRAIVAHSVAYALPLDAAWHDCGTPERWQEALGAPPAHPAHPRTDRPWGYYELLAEAPGTVEKRLILYPGCRLSLQRHAHRHEAWTVLKGLAHVELDGSEYALATGHHISIAPGQWHRLENRSTETIIMHEIQIGNPSESDIERAADDYGRIVDSQFV